MLTCIDFGNPLCSKMGVGTNNGCVYQPTSLALTLNKRKLKQLFFHFVASCISLYSLSSLRRFFFFLYHFSSGRKFFISNIYGNSNNHLRFAVKRPSRETQILAPCTKIVFLSSIFGVLFLIRSSGVLE